MENKRMNTLFKNDKSKIICEYENKIQLLQLIMKHESNCPIVQLKKKS